MQGAYQCTSPEKILHRRNVTERQSSHCPPCVKICHRLAIKWLQNALSLAFLPFYRTVQGQCKCQNTNENTHLASTHEEYFQPSLLTTLFFHLFNTLQVLCESSRVLLRKTIYFLIQERTYKNRNVSFISVFHLILFCYKLQFHIYNERHVS